MGLGIRSYCIRRNTKEFYYPIQTLNLDSIRQTLLANLTITQVLAQVSLSISLKLRKV